ncbi:TetR/AcrR family transcriptional regulator [Pseudonocardia pini]|uniref:TetR/AcrR family transcriptional regulator n=1 Tax=Pseudonocardia pini TaxID=2758030 RepID=UPI0015F07BD5|nr:TetR/AcrR family transcriptional regulator [Pseudonocardia pini]
MVSAEKPAAARRASPGAGLPPTTLVLPGDEPTAAALIAAAVEVMAVHGYHGTSVRDIAAAAGTSPAILYHHFTSKQVLLATMLDRGLDVLIAATEQALDLAGEDPADRLRAVVEAHVRVHLDSQRESLLGNSELRALDPSSLRVVVAKRDVQQRIFDRVIRDGVRREVFGTTYPEDTARFVTSACTAVAAWYRAGGPLSAEEIVRHHQEIALDAVRWRR